MMRCDEVREKLPDYLYELLPDWQMEEIAAHTKGCSDCHEACEAAANEFKTLDEWDVPGPAADTCPEFMRKLRSHQVLALAPQSAAAGLMHRPWSSALVRIAGMVRRWRAMPTGAKIAVTSVSLAAVASLAFGLMALTSWRSAQAGQPKVIEGVPAIGWTSEKTSYYIAALHACLQAMGSPIRYEELMVASGAAFCTGWSPGAYKYDSRVAAPEDLVLNGASAAGATADRRSFESLDEAWALVCASIDEGRPVIGSYVSAARVICGYDPRDRQMHFLSHNATEPGCQIAPFQASSGPNRRPNEFIFVEYNPAADLPELDWPAILWRAVRFADWPRERRIMLGDPVAFGLGAYDEWAATLRRGPDASGVALDTRLTVTMAKTLADCRAAASVVLIENAALHHGFRDAADYYMAEAGVLESMRNVLAQGQTGLSAEVMAAAERNFADPTVREQAAQLIEQAKEHEILAVDALREVLDDIAPEPVQAPPQPIVTVTPTRDPQRAEEAYRRGLELKRAGKMAEAAEQLRTAVEADGEHLAARYALGWVLVELKDNDGAAAAFRKVIELAPGSKQAAEAQAALERLGQ
jgi:hypothetical protein